ncbi:phosphatase PAP2 family protein [Bacillus thermotolerans]|uniref:Phosphatidic acid phosphatase type 2/haloperoxidase domain-containing protein n=1 Tax=Bacillus thermotolerans TaxID=1221996 RepID=A0A0F5I3M2_BACTR|nr:phosphatase PAP2 family protein [Bacillus thermotolerans]KKB40116.1 hypothetical protein QY95_01855 [Bacillus thermotolerans]
MDQAIFQYVNDLAGNNGFLDHFMILLSKWGIYVFIAIILVLAFSKKWRWRGFRGIGALILALIVSRLLKYAVNRDRPFITDEVNLLFEKTPSPSFPSDQAVASGVFAAFLFLAFPKWRWLGMILALVISFSRVYVGHHYPLDVLTGLFLGALCMAVVHKLQAPTQTAER